jgi:Tat protein secretion system quality control protein TatD with DNase activity
MAVFYDTHAHLTYPDFAEELPQVVSRAQAAGIARIICIGTDLERSQRVIRGAEQFPNALGVVGRHPSHPTQAPSYLRPALRELARHPKVVGLGETGLDYHRLPSSRKGGTAADGELDKFMLETDCPFLAPMPYRGKRCEPAFVKKISEVAAQVKGCSLEELSAATFAMADEFFRLKQ